MNNKEIDELIKLINIIKKEIKFFDIQLKNLIDKINDIKIILEDKDLQDKDL